MPCSLVIRAATPRCATISAAAAISVDAFGRKEYDRVFEITLPHAIRATQMPRLSYRCFMRLGVKRDLLEAERWLLKSTGQNNPTAWNNLGTSMPHSYPSYGIAGTMHGTLSDA